MEILWGHIRIFTDFSDIYPQISKIFRCQPYIYKSMSHVLGSNGRWSLNEWWECHHNALYVILGERACVYVCVCVCVWVRQRP